MLWSTASAIPRCKAAHGKPPSGREGRQKIRNRHGRSYCCACFVICGRAPHPSRLRRATFPRGEGVQPLSQKSEIFDSSPYTGGPLGAAAPVGWMGVRRFLKGRPSSAPSGHLPPGGKVFGCCRGGGGENVNKNGNRAVERNRPVFVQVVKSAKKRGLKPRNCEKYSLTNADLWCRMKVHTVIVCPFMDSTSNMVILPQERAAVKW